jgi:hypothetical protein
VWFRPVVADAVSLYIMCKTGCSNEGDCEDLCLTDVASCGVLNCVDVSEDSATSFVSLHVKDSHLH